MKKSVIFIVFLLCGLLLCSCCKNRDGGTASDAVKNTASVATSKDASQDTQSEHKNDGGAVSSNPKSESKTNSTPAAIGVETQNNSSDSSAKDEAPPLDADEYELPFIPN